MEAFEVKGEIDDKGKLIVKEVLPVYNKKVRVLLMIEEEEREDWLQGSANILNQAYGDDEPEYSLDLVKEPNPKYVKHG